MKLTTKQNDDLAVRKGKDKEGHYIELTRQCADQSSAAGKKGGRASWRIDQERQFCTRSLLN